MSGANLWTERLYSKIHSADTSDKKIVEFLTKKVDPNESKIIDYKRKLRWGAENEGEAKERKAKIIKSVSAFANVPHRSKYRFLFVGFGDDGEFIGISEWDLEGGERICDIDESKLQDIISEYLEPTPSVSRYDLYHKDNDSSIIIIEEAEQKPVMTTKNIKSKNGKTVLERNTAYTRKGSSNRAMKSSDFRTLIERRQEIITNAFQNVADDLQQVVGIPSSQLEDISLSATPTEDGVPVREVLSVEPVSEPDDQLTVSTRNWNSTGELASDRKTIYDFCLRKDDLDLTQKKTEFLIYSSLYNYLVGYYWIRKYLQMEADWEALIKSYLNKYANGNNIVCLEKVLLMLNDKNMLETLKKEKKIECKKSDEYLELCGQDPVYRLNAAETRNTVSFNNEKYSLSNIVSGKIDGEAILQEAINTVSNEDIGNNRTKLRSVELALLGTLR